MGEHSERTDTNQDQPPNNEVWGKDAAPKKELWETTLDGVLHPKRTSPPKSNDHPPHPAQADQIARRIFTPPTIDLGTTTVGERTVHPVSPIYTLLTGGSEQLQATVAGIPAVSVEHAPTSVFNNSRTYMADDDVRLAFAPKREGHVVGSLDLETTSRGRTFTVENPTQKVRIPIVGEARGTTSPLVPFPSRIDLGEQIVGSSHSFAIGATKLARDSPVGGTVTRAVKAPENADIPDVLKLDMGTEAFRVDQKPNDIWQASTDAGLAHHVHFKPHRPGRFRSDVAVTVRWSNGEVEEQQIAVTAGARNLEDAPPQPVQPAATTRAPLDPAMVGGEPTPTQVSNFGTAATKASDKAHLLADRQRDGLMTVHDELVGGDKQVPKPSVFAQLADLAITMAVGGVAQVVGKLLARNLVGAVQNLDPGPIKSTQLVDGLGSAFKDGLKAAAKHAIDTSSSAGAGILAGDHGSPESRDAVVDFFARQRTILTTLADNNRTLVRDEQTRLLPALAAHPNSLLLIFEQLAESFEAAAVDAPVIQARATVSKWVSGLAQETGKSSASRDGTSLGPTTALTPSRWSHDRDGVLQLTATLEGESRLTLDRAELYGVASAAANRLTEVALAGVGIPIRLTVKSRVGTAYITRDEVGRVLIEGDLPKSSAWEGRESGVQANRGARELCDQIMSKSLVDWKVKLETNIESSEKVQR